MDVGNFEQNMATIAIDFDGVLAKYKEWNDYEHAGEQIGRAHV